MWLRTTGRTSYKKLKEAGYKLIMASNPIFPIVAQKNVFNGQD